MHRAMLKRIPVDLLIPGMFISDICGSWMEHPFWRTTFLLNDPQDIARLRECGIHEVWIDTSKGCDLKNPAALQVMEQDAVVAEIERTLSEAAAAPAEGRYLMREELARASLLCDNARKAMMSMFSEARMGNAIRAGDVAPLVERIADSLQRNQSALISLARLKTRDNYTYLHSVAVGALMMSLARQLGLGEDAVREAGMAGLLHDLGKAAIPDAVLNKPGKLTDAEFEVIKSHPERGHRMLSRSRGVSEVALDVCLRHHEKMDGTGYPGRFPAEKISLFARMGAVCDVYDAITSNRPYKSGWDPAESIRRMAEWCKGHFDERVFQAFVRCVGIYPVGSLVRLASGRLGVVIEQGRDSLLKPTVKVFFSTRSNAHIAPEVMDLARPGTADHIVSTEPPEKWGFRHLETLWQEG